MTYLFIPISLYISYVQKHTYTHMAGGWQAVAERPGQCGPTGVGRTPGFIPVTLDNLAADKQGMGLWLFL